MKSKLLAVLVFSASTAFAAAQPGLMSGELTFALKTAGPPIVLSRLDKTSIYDKLEKDLGQTKLDGAAVLGDLRELEPKLGPIEEGIGARVNAIIKFSPQADGDTFQALDKNPWAGPLFNYSAGDDSDDEQVYVWVNRDLRGPAPHQKKTIAFIAKMRQALSHLPLINGITFRGTRMTSERVNKFYPVGQLARDPALISTSLEPSTAFNFARPLPPLQADKDDAGKIAVVFVVQGKTGRSISAFAYMESHEQEILFANGTPFTVKSKTDVFTDPDLGKTVVIVLAE